MVAAHEHHRRIQRPEGAQDQLGLLRRPSVGHVAREQHRVDGHSATGGEPRRGARAEHVVVDVTRQQQPHDLRAGGPTWLGGQFGCDGFKTVDEVLQTTQTVALVSAPAERADERQQLGHARREPLVAHGGRAVDGGIGRERDDDADQHSGRGAASGAQIRRRREMTPPTSTPAAAPASSSHGMRVSR